MENTSYLMNTSAVTATEENIPSSEMINGEGPVEDNLQLYSDDESVKLYSMIVSVIDFMKTEVDEHRHNIQQLKAMEKSLKKAFTYRDVVTKYIDSNKIQRTWGDWNEYTGFLSN